MADYDESDKSKGEPTKRGPGRPRKVQPAPAGDYDNADGRGEEPREDKPAERKPKKPYPARKPDEKPISQVLPAFAANAVRDMYSMAMLHGAIDPGSPVLQLAGGPRAALDELTALTFNATERLSQHFLGDLKPGPVTDAASVAMVLGGGVYLTRSIGPREYKQIATQDDALSIFGGAPPDDTRTGDLCDVTDPAQPINLTRRARQLGLA